VLDSPKKLQARENSLGTCLNCGGKLPNPPRIFQGILICEDCFKMVSHFVKRTREEFRMLFLVYTDLLRAALVKGELRPPRAAPGPELPAQEFAKAFQQMAQKFGGLNVHKKKETDGEGAMSPLRVDDGNTDGPARSG